MGQVYHAERQLQPENGVTRGPSLALFYFAFGAAACLFLGRRGGRAVCTVADKEGSAFLLCLHPGLASTAQ